MNMRTSAWPWRVVDGELIVDALGYRVATACVRYNRNVPMRADETLVQYAAHATDAEAFAKAKASGLKWPKMNLGAFALSLAGDQSRNPGAIYVKDDAGTYLGKVASGRFCPSRDCTPETQADVVKVITDPLGEAKAYGLRTGMCCICSRTLTDPVSIANGIGPICEGRFFG